MSAKLFLIPNTLGQENIDEFLPKSVVESVVQLRVFAVEEIKSARRLLRKIDKTFPIDECKFFILNKNTNSQEIDEIFNILKENIDIGLISEAGTPCVADPGAILVEKAHCNNVVIKPLIGPSSIILSLMSSGLNGQNFTFHGYLPKERTNRIKKLKEIERQTLKYHDSHIFIETPYRNQHLYNDIIENINNEISLCLAINLTINSEKIKTKTIKKWKDELINFNKEQCIFILCKTNY